LIQIGPINYLMVSGRAVIYPVYKGTYERNTGQTSVWPQPTRAYEDWMVQLVNDARRAVDYLASRNDIALDSLAFYGLSWGGALGPKVLALDPRFKSAVLLDGGISQGSPAAVVDSMNFAPRVTVPVLMINGDSDFIFPLASSQKPLVNLFATPPEHKRHVVLRSGHNVIGQQRSQVVRHVLDWLDRYQGPVAR
jgi:pimeloyl-ACP methyl ester carboxylesterase